MNNNASSSSKEGKNKRQVLEECNLLVQEYLQRNQLVRTCKEFQKECSELQLPLPKIISGEIIFLTRGRSPSIQGLCIQWYSKGLEKQHKTTTSFKFVNSLKSSRDLCKPYLQQITQWVQYWVRSSDKKTLLLFIIGLLQ